MEDNGRGGDFVLQAARYSSVVKFCNELLVKLSSLTGRRKPGKGFGDHDVNDDDHCNVNDDENVIDDDD